MSGSMSHMVIQTYKVPSWKHPRVDSVSARVFVRKLPVLTWEYSHRLPGEQPSEQSSLYPMPMVLYPKWYWQVEV
jgi:hypothetical protein